MARSMAANLTYNEKGNAVTFEFPYQSNPEYRTPGLFADIPPREVAKGEVIYHQGEPGASLYYIVKGQYEVAVHEKIVSTLSPDDLFMGEMSFLLNNRRSATVRACSNGKLIEISKKTFVDAIKKKPHYALFLSRLLAQRIQRLNNRAANNRS